ncbi:MAG: hypothetical protein B9S32_00340 [Verrucomicrobia bacterium Tous-C9LFEB]|nr:MAG: hypothetical protein B9S32_00340 [Verrucomicrobia bacterium Tous-C9LFEB]
MILLPRLERWLAAGVVVTFLLGTARGQNAPTMEPQQILKELELIQKNRSGQFKSGLRQQIDALTAASATKQAAVALYEDAIQAVEHEGKPKDGAEFATWREKNKEMLLDDDFRTALQLHLRYLVLSLKRLDGDKVEDLMPSLLEYTGQLSTNISDLIKREKARNDVQERNEKYRPKDKQGEKINKAVLSTGRDILNKPMSGSVFVRWYRLEGHIGAIKDWEQSSGNIEGIVDKMLMPYMREKKDVRLLELWDDRMARAEELARKSDLAIDLDKYQNQTLPTLLWKKAEDRLLLGQRAVALTDMFNVVKGYQSHPDFEKWSKQLFGLLKSDGATETAAASGAP